MQFLLLLSLERFVIINLVWMEQKKKQPIEMVLQNNDDDGRE